jgi:GNAT superfamily N-acetyltransferase
MSIHIRPVVQTDYTQWLTLWHGYNAFYGRQNNTALPDAITATTWARFFDDNQPVYALVAKMDGVLVGIAHYLFHLSTTRIEPTCYMQDLFTNASSRGQGVGRRLIDGVYTDAMCRGAKRVYWQTHITNTVGRTLYDRVAKHAGFIVYGQDVG